MTRKLRFKEGAYYHVFNRGTDKRVTFEDDIDRDRFLRLALACNGTVPVRLCDRRKPSFGEIAVLRGERLVDLCVYCLMDNHFHVVVRERKAGGLSLYMQKLGTGYTGFFNRRHGRSGVLFQGEFKAVEISDEHHLLTVISYVNMNPIASSQQPNGTYADADLARAAAYPHSSLPDYLEAKRPQGVLLDRESLPPDFGSWPLCTRLGLVQSLV